MVEDDGVSDGTALLVDDSDGSVTTLELLVPDPQFVHGAVVTGDA